MSLYIYPQWGLFGFIEKRKCYFWEKDITYSGLPQLQYVGVKWGKETGLCDMNITIVSTKKPNELSVLEVWQK